MTNIGRSKDQVVDLEQGTFWGFLAREIRRLLRGAAPVKRPACQFLFFLSSIEFFLVAPRRPTRPRISKERTYPQFTTNFLFLHFCTSSLCLCASTTIVPYVRFGVARSCSQNSLVPTGKSDLQPHHQPAFNFTKPCWLAFSPAPSAICALNKT